MNTATNMWSHDVEDTNALDAYHTMIVQENEQKQEQAKILKESIVNEKASKFNKATDDVINAFNDLVKFIAENTENSEEVQEKVNELSEGIKDLNEKAVEAIKA